MRSSSRLASWRQLVVFGEKFLEFVDDQQRPRHLLARGLAIHLKVLRLEGAEKLGTAGHLLVDALQHAQAEFAVAFDGDRPRMRKMVHRVGLEFNALLEVDEIKLNLIRRIPHRQIADQRVQQRRFTRTGLAGDQRVLRDAPAEAKGLHAGGAGAADCDADVAVALERPELRGLGGDKIERHFHALGLASTFADVMEDFGQLFVGGRGVERQGELVEDRIAPDEAFALADEVDAVRFEIVDVH